MINNLSDTEKIVDFFGFRPILSSSIKVTRNCNLHCKHCYVHTNNGEKNIPLSENNNYRNKILTIITKKNIKYNTRHP